MGTIPLCTMKLLLALVPLLGLGAVSGEATCAECSAVVSALAADLTSERSVSGQIDVLLAEVCPGSENPDECLEGLPDFWTRIAAVLWPGYYNPRTDWMCGPICAKTSVREVTCDECLNGIQGSIDQLLSEEFINGIVDALSGDGFCGMEEDPDRCAEIIPILIPAALPALAAMYDPAGGAQLCNMALPGTC